MLEQLYSDFTNKLLPQLQEGLSITKDYFVELFGRYVKYLIITDIIQIVACLLIITVGVVIALRARKSWKERADWAKTWNNDRNIETVGFITSTVIILFGTIALFSSVTDLAKTLYVPEIRVYEEITSYRQSTERLDSINNR